eukprot:TRINITY_DN112737_c0_g1_i1.p1 TRINITY_DN112737_c0_g1~~TRINITY_DN112737_c0_g1_i1.p1  ORF type:complete len:381 (-),score=45.71 TRINITY_DN112737_c0_g1_i1:102-1244(-)
MASSADGDDANMQVVRLWQLPDDFFSLSLEAQWKAVSAVTVKAPKLSKPRPACPMSLGDEALIVSYLFLTLGFPWFAGAGCLAAAVMRSKYFFYGVGVMALLAVHPMPKFSVWLRSSRLSLALIRYFSFELFVDRNDPEMQPWATPAVDDIKFQREKHLPAVYLACPHGVFNYGAIAWCCISRWIAGWYQYTGGANALSKAPCLRYLDQLIWLVGAERASIKRALQEPLDEAQRRGGLMGMVPDGILGAFRSKPGVDELMIGSKRGLIRICMEEGATIYGSWFFGTTDMLTVLQDPFGLMEAFSRKTKVPIMGYCGRWFLPVPYRIAVSLCVHPVRTTKTTAPSNEEVEKVHQQVYGGLVKTYEKYRPFAGYPDRKLVVK